MSKIVNLLVDSEADILNKLIERMSETGLVHDLVTFFQHDAELLNMLGDRAIDGDLSIEARWRLLHTLMSTGISSCKGAEKAVESLLVSVEGDELSELKSKQDSSGDRHSMHKLIFEDIARGRLAC
ncbi:unnamed protein product [Prorocentrum cordatum]|uniref:Uncharacterized protein n=1 Tax=Prorocentrum cordatum TaxID=2364126 RepID=A0ABN9XIH3_9DINO|nr:unnamed protein product [Polarella glacialis]